MSVTFNETGDAALCSFGAYCSGVPTGVTNVAWRAEVDGAAKGAPDTIGVPASAPDAVCLGWEIYPPWGYAWSTGTWTVGINNSANANLTWVSLFICQVSAGCVNKATMASALGLTTSLGLAGPKTNSVTQNSRVIPANGDRVWVLLGFSNSVASVQTFTNTSGQTIVSPMNPGGPSLLGLLSVGLVVRPLRGLFRPRRVADVPRTECPPCAQMEELAGSYS